MKTAATFYEQQKIYYKIPYSHILMNKALRGGEQLEFSDTALSADWGCITPC
jgi:hypothetical protein